MNHRLCLLILPLLLGACSSGEQEKTPPLMSQRMSDRIASSRKRMSDQNDRSVFDKAIQSSITKGKDTGGWLGKKGYKSNPYTGVKSYTNTKEFKTSGYSGADNQSSMGKQTFAQSNKTSPQADESFKTGSSSFADQTAREDGQAFSGAGDVFKTSANRDALRSQIKNEGPKFIRLDEQTKGPAYSEDQVRRLLGRQ